MTTTETKHETLKPKTEAEKAAEKAAADKAAATTPPATKTPLPKAPPNPIPPPLTGLTAQYFGGGMGEVDHFYFVQANYPGGPGVVSGAAKVTTPTGLSKDNKVLLTWDPSPSAIDYSVARSDTEADPTDFNVKTQTNSFTDDGSLEASGAAVRRIEEEVKKEEEAKKKAEEEAKKTEAKLTETSSPKTEPQHETHKVEHKLK